MNTSHLNNLRQILYHAVDTVRPENLLTNKRIYDFQPKTEKGMTTIKIQDDKINIDNKNIHLVGFGKAVIGMAVFLNRQLGPYIVDGCLSTPVSSMEQYKTATKLSADVKACISIHEGALMNLPDEAARNAAKNIYKLVHNLNKNDIVFVLISGGGSALLPMPRSPMQLLEKCNLIRKLSNCGASIIEMNTVRIALSNIKGNRLAMAGHNAFGIISLVISDIVGDPVDIIASGPTSPVIDRGENAAEILKKYKLYDNLAPYIQKMINEQISEAQRTKCKNSLVYLVGSNMVAATSALEKAQEMKYEAFVVSTSIEGDLTEVTSKYVQLLKALRSYQNKSYTEDELKTLYTKLFSSNNALQFITFMKKIVKDKKEFILILGGEPTVVLTGKGTGGRCQELALRMSLEMYQNDLSNFAFLSGSTDGADGPTPASGAIGGHFVINDYLSLNDNNRVNDVERIIADNNSYTFYNNLNRGNYHIVTGLTGTNVMDLHFILATNASGSKDLK